MASASSLQETDETFLHCSICLDSLKDPKTLPCLHRYCKKCLHKIAEEKGAVGDGESNNVLECPSCKKRHSLPPGGVDELTDDTSATSIIENFDTLSSRERSSAKNGPRCENHPGYDFVTCDKQPVCVSCMSNDHKDHDLQDVVSLSAAQKKHLKYKLELLMPFKKQFYKMQEQTHNARERLRYMVDKKQSELFEQLKREEEKIKIDTADIDEYIAEKKHELDESLKMATSAKKLKIEKELEQANLKYNKLRQKYIDLCEEETKEAKKESQKLEADAKSQKASMLEKIETLNKGISDLMISIKSQEEEISRTISILSEELDNIGKMIEEVETASANLLESEEVWTHVENVPDICKSIDKLIEDIKRKVPTTESITDIKIRGLSAVIPSHPIWANITDNPELEADIAGDEVPTWCITGITCSVEGNIVISGETSPYNSYITEIDVNGHRLREERIGTPSSRLAWRYCDFLSENKIATVCRPNEIGVYNIKSGKYKKTKISDVIGRWSPEMAVSCVSADRESKHIFVCGKDTRDVCVFDNHLKDIRTLVLPAEIKSPSDITVHMGGLIVCDSTRNRAHIVSIEEFECKLKRELAKPDHMDGAEWSPYSVCTDTKGLIYLLWGTESASQVRRILVQYNQDGRHLLTRRTVDSDAWCIATMETVMCEKILVATYKTRKLITYGLVSGVLATN